eukprot:CAMPEP_0206511024 /NCGR_PEP_ID=MMETSP0324_2-20121206/60047_1 /ASSEMBLY_ACC=CAM_ASM_000836 /TAXON_ID=2866 /ORGANISM="Crypthecodinium cohnii, Strain Seligo" /LENGTH=117 /DNA_ID=CAMNT_0054002731 /DNA_START=9 /DNA_END=362 /DNA_ORIENTATION=+
MTLNLYDVAVEAVDQTLCFSGQESQIYGLCWPSESVATTDEFSDINLAMSINVQQLEQGLRFGDVHIDLPEDLLHVMFRHHLRKLLPGNAPAAIYVCGFEEGVEVADHVDFLVPFCC